jgi:hypothetical protein
MKCKKLCKNNLDKEDRLFLKSIKENPEIIIKKADKGSAVVIINTTDYLREGYQQLSDAKFYQKLDHDLTKKISIKINKIIQEMKDKNIITQCTSMGNPFAPSEANLFLGKLEERTDNKPVNPLRYIDDEFFNGPQELITLTSSWII